MHLYITSERDLIDREYGEESILYVSYAPGVSDASRDALAFFRIATSARMNWNLSIGILVGFEEQPHWV